MGCVRWIGFYDKDYTTTPFIVKLKNALGFPHFAPRPAEGGMVRLCRTLEALRQLVFPFRAASMIV